MKYDVDFGLFGDGKLAKTVISRCVICKKIPSKSFTAAIFTQFTGTDFAGPLLLTGYFPVPCARGKLMRICIQIPCRGVLEVFQVGSRREHNEDLL